MNVYLSRCQYSLLNRSLLVLKQTYCHRIYRAPLPVCLHANHVTKLFSTTSQNRQESDLRTRKNLSCYRRNGTAICSSKYIMHPPRRFFSEVENDKKKKPVTFSTDKDVISGGNYTKENILMPETFPIYVFPTFSAIFDNLMAGSNIGKVDKGLTVIDFMNGARKAIFVIANLLSSGSVDEIESLTTPAAFQQIKENYAKVPATHLDRLGQLDDDMILIPIRHIHRVRVRHPVNTEKDEEEKLTLEIVLLLDGYQKKSMDEKFSMFHSVKDRTKFCCTARFEREYIKVEKKTWESSDSWKVSGISYVMRDIVDGEDQNFII